MATTLTYTIAFVTDMDQAVRFYRDTIGLALKFQSPDWSEFATGDTTLALHPASAANPASSDNGMNNSVIFWLSLQNTIRPSIDYIVTMIDKSVEFIESSLVYSETSSSQGKKEAELIILDSSTENSDEIGSAEDKVIELDNIAELGVRQDVLDQQELLKTHRRTLVHYLSQMAQLGGSAHTPPGVIEGIRESRENIHRIKNVLRRWGIVVEEHPDDLPTTPANFLNESNSLQHVMDDEEREAHELRLRNLRRKAALLGLDAPPEIYMEIEDIENKLRGVDVQQTDLEINERRLKLLKSTSSFLGPNTSPAILIEITTIEDRIRELSNTIVDQKISIATTGKDSTSRSLIAFLCHSSADKPQVRILYQKLQADGIEPWLDEENLLPGQEWRQEIPKAVRASDVVIVCLTGSVIQYSRFVLDHVWHHRG